MFFALETGQETFFCFIFSPLFNDHALGHEVSKHFGFDRSQSHDSHIDRHHPQASLKSFYQEPSSVALNDIKVQLVIHSDSDCLLSFTHVVLFYFKNT